MGSLYVKESRSNKTKFRKVLKNNETEEISWATPTPDPTTFVTWIILDNLLP